MRLLTRAGDFGVRHARPLVALALLLILAAPWSLSGLRIETDVSRLIPPDEPVASAYRENRRLFGERNPLLLLIEAGVTDRAVLDRFADALAGRLREWPDIARVEHRWPGWSPGPAGAARLRAVLLGGGADLRARFAETITAEGIRRELARTRRRIVTADDPSVRDRLAADPLGMESLIQAFLAERLPLRASPALEGYFDRPDGNGRLVVAQPRGSAEDSAYCRALLDRLDALVTEVREGTPGAGAIAVRATGAHAITGQSTAALVPELTGISALATLALLALLWAVFRDVRPTVLCFVPLVVSQIGVLVVARLFLNPINSLAIGFAAVVGGIGVDATLHLTARFATALASCPVPQAVRRTFAEAGPPIVIGVATTVAAFLTLLLADMRGLTHFAVLTSVGLVLNLGVSFALFPALATLLFRRPTAVGASPTWLPARLFRAPVTHPRLAAAASVLLIAASLPSASRFELHADLAHLVPERLDALRVAREVNAAFGAALALPTEVTLVSPDPAAALDAQRALDARLIQMKQAGAVAGFASVSIDVAPPPDPPLGAWLRARHAQLAAGADDFAAALGALRFRASPELQAYYASLVSALDPDGDARADAGEADRDMARAADGRVHLLTTVWPAAAPGALDALETQASARVAAGLAAIPVPAGVEVRVSSLVQVYLRANEMIRADFARLGWAATLAVTLVVWAFLGRPLSVLASLVPLAAALPVTLAAVVLAGVKVTPSAISFVAIIVGIGIDDAVHVLVRARGRPAGELADVMEDIGPVLTLTSLSTAVGFGALCLSSLPVVSSLGAVIAAGVFACWLFSVVLVPAVWMALGRARRPAVGAAVLACAMLLPGPARAQTGPVAPILDRLRERYDSFEALSCEIRQSKSLRQLEGTIQLTGTLLFQKPALLKMELRGDENVDLYVNGRELALVDRDLGDVDRVALSEQGAPGRLARWLPSLVLLSPGDLERRYAVERAAPARGEYRLVLRPRDAGGDGLQRIDIELDGRYRAVWMRVEYTDGDWIETVFEGWTRLPRRSEALFEYREKGDGGIFPG